MVKNEKRSGIYVRVAYCNNFYSRGEEKRWNREGTKEAGERARAIRSKLTIDSSETAAWHDPLPRSFPEIDDSVDVKIQSQKQEGE